MEELKKQIRTGDLILFDSKNTGIFSIFDSAIKVWINSFNENIDNRKWLQESVSDILTNQNFIDMKAFVQCSGDSQKIKELEIQIRKKTLNVIEEYLVKKNRV